MYEKLYCPHCSTPSEYELWEALTDDGEETEVECNHCDKEFKVRLSIEYNYYVCDEDD